MAARNTAPPSFIHATDGHPWTQELPIELRVVVREQARQYHLFLPLDLESDQWRRIITGLEREAIAVRRELGASSSIEIVDGTPSRADSGAEYSLLPRLRR